MRCIIDNETALAMLMSRCDVWETSRENYDLYEKMYSSYIDGGVFEDTEFDTMTIVDNDVVNYTTIVHKGDEDFDKLMELYHKDERDVSCEEFKYYVNLSYIEAVSDDEERILVRY